MVRRRCAESGLDPASLCLEITESALMEAGAATTAQLRALKALGVRLAIDDFGTGFSSLAHLRRFPVDMLKIDRTFVAGLGDEAQDAAIAAAVISLAHALGLTTVAEGIETDEQLEVLRELGCDLGPGLPLRARRSPPRRLCGSWTLSSLPRVPDVVMPRLSDSMEEGTILRWLKADGDARRARRRARRDRDRQGDRDLRGRARRALLESSRRRARRCRSARTIATIGETNGDQPPSAAPPPRDGRGARAR